MWFIVDIMILRGYARDVGSLMLTIAGIGNCVGRLGGGAIRYYLRFVCFFMFGISQIINPCRRYSSTPGFSAMSMLYVTAVSGAGSSPALATCETSQVLLEGVPGGFSRGSPVFAHLPSHMS